MFVYFAVSQTSELKFKIGFSYGTVSNKKRNLRQSHCMEIMKIVNIEPKDIRGGVWIEHTTQELMKSALWYIVKQESDDCFSVRTVEDLFNIYHTFPQFVSRSQEEYNKLFKGAQ